MKWDKALKQIKKALKEGENVEIRYHRKWMKNDSHYGTVDCIQGYTYKDHEYQAVFTYYDQIDEDTHIIDCVRF